MPSNHLTLSYPLVLLPSVFSSITVFSNESVLLIMWPKYWSFSFSISPFSEYSGLISFRMDWLDLLAVQGTLKSLLQQKHQQKHQEFKSINSSVLSSLYSPTLISIHDHWKSHILEGPRRTFVGKVMSLLFNMLSRLPKAVYCHPAYLNYMKSTSCGMLGWVKHKLESRLLAEISITSDMQMTPPLRQISKN